MALLELQDVHSYYGNIHALKGISMVVNEGEIVTLIGSNGAGKSTTLRTISGLLTPRRGQVVLNGKRIDNVPAHEIVKLGLSQSPEVLENLEMGAYTRPARDGEFESDLQRVFELFPRLRERVSQKGGTLSGGEQQMLAIGRALMSRPRILLLDEPSMGLAPILVDQIFSIIQDINKQGTTILLVEQNALKALEIAHTGYVLQTGEIVFHDTAANLQRNEVVQKAYLGLD
jgi:branched-chain amino acid transport system ATP-binding protein